MKTHSDCESRTWAHGRVTDLHWEARSGPQASVRVCRELLTAEQRSTVLCIKLPVYEAVSIFIPKDPNIPRRLTQVPPPPTHTLMLFKNKQIYLQMRPFCLFFSGFWLDLFIWCHTAPCFCCSLSNKATDSTVNFIYLCAGHREALSST